MASPEQTPGQTQRMTMNLSLIIFALLLLMGLVYGYYATLGILNRKLLQEQASTKSALQDIFQWRLGLLILLSVVGTLIIISGWNYRSNQSNLARHLDEKIKSVYDTASLWSAPDPAYILQSPNKDLIQYGRQLISSTSDFFGPKGIVKPMSNGMNCQNCHLNAGTKPWGNNYSAVLANYPKFRARSGTEENIMKRINDCFQRSLNGDSLELNSREMKAMVSYIQWVGQAVPKQVVPKGSGLAKLKPLDRPADPQKGNIIYQLKCQTCHGSDGSGLPRPDFKGQYYPPLWGDHSYNEAAGLFRLSSFAGYVKANMPFGANFDNPQLTDEEAWDVAAFINSQPRPKHKFLDVDWPVVSKKPYDHPFGPYADSFSVAQHKYGPFQPIIKYQSISTK